MGYLINDVVEFFRKHNKDFREDMARYQAEFLFDVRGSRKGCNVFTQ